MKDRRGERRKFVSQSNINYMRLKNERLSEKNILSVELHERRKKNIKINS